MGVQDDGIMSTSKGATTSDPQGRRTLQTFVGCMIVLGVFLLMWMNSESQLLQGMSGDVKLRSSVFGAGNSPLTSISMEAHAICETICTERKEHPSKKNHYYGSPLDLMDIATMLQRAKSAKRTLIEKLREDYGNLYFEQIFLDDETGNFRPVVPVTPDGPSMERLQRKLSIKLLSVQENVKKHEASVNNGQCDCWNGNVAIVPNPTQEEDDKDETQTVFFEKYIWATGGHSSAAGHGNLFNETYTYFMERDLIDVFGAVGIEFVGRNYAMGGTPSSSEIAMCWEQIFGSDVDFFSWDYGMTDGNNAERMLHYGLRGGLSSGKPAFMGIHIGGRTRTARENRIEQLETMGMAGFVMNDDLLSNMKKAVPDSAGITEKELQALPEYVRNLKCDGGIEKGEPYCGKEKFTHYICDGRGKQGSWHPGWKEHAMTGHGMALFLADVLVSALTKLAENPGVADSQVLLEPLQKEEESLFQNLTQVPLPTGYDKLFDTRKKGLPSEFDQSLFYKGRSFCHTGRLPSQTRYLGYLTESNKIGGPAPWGTETYERGIHVKKAKEIDAKGTMRLVYEDRDRVSDCPVTCMPDAKDTFMTHYQDGWTLLSLPNDKEREAYFYDPKNFQGVVVVILRSCDWGKCESGFLTREDFESKKWKMKVNGIEVKTLVDIGFEALVAEGPDGIYFAPNSNGAFDIEMKVNEEDSFVLVSSFVLY